MQFADEHKRTPGLGGPRVRNGPAFGWDVESAIRSDERDRIACELHDSTSQLLVTLELQIMGLKSLSSVSRSNVFDDVLGELGTTIAELHEGVRALGRPDEVPCAGLAERLTAMAAEFAGRAGLKVRTAICQVPEGISPPIAKALFRVAQEALANISRHARATEVRVSLVAEAGRIGLTVTDNGVGFARRPAMPGAGRGLANMKARLEEIGGRLSVRNLRHGAVVEATVKLDALSQATSLSLISAV